ncbi:MAG: signal peptidase I [Bacteroidia bacterium]|jgi:signal peptidase I
MGTTSLIKTRNWKIRLGVGSAVVFLALLLLRTFVVRLYSVESISMEPTIHGDGEQVLVFFGAAENLKRYDMVVIDRGEGGPPIVKRIGGLPGEGLRLVDGDLFVDGTRAGKLGNPAPAVTLFDSDVMEIDECFVFRSQADGATTADFPWNTVAPDPDVLLQLNALSLEPGRETGMMRYASELRDSYIDGEGELEKGLHTVNDAAVAFEFRVVDVAPGARIRARLVEEGDTFEALLEINADGDGYSLRIERNPGEVLAASPLAAGTLPDLGSGKSSGWLRLGLSNVDNRLVATLHDVETSQQLLHLQADYDANRPYLGAGYNPGQVRARSVASRVGIGGEAVRMDLRRVEVMRDLFIIPVGEFGVQRSFVLGPSEYFLLGDNSSKSADSRLWGPIPASAIIGRPTRIALPLDRARPLE